MVVEHSLLNGRLEFCVVSKTMCIANPSEDDTDDLCMLCGLR